MKEQIRAEKMKYRTEKSRTNETSVSYLKKIKRINKLLNKLTIKK